MSKNVGCHSRGAMEWSGISPGRPITPFRLFFHWTRYLVFGLFARYPVLALH